MDDSNLNEILQEIRECAPVLYDRYMHRRALLSERAVNTFIRSVDDWTVREDKRIYALQINAQILNTQICAYDSGISAKTQDHKSKVITEYNILARQIEELNRLQSLRRGVETRNDSEHVNKIYSFDHLMG